MKVYCGSWVAKNGSEGSLRFKSTSASGVASLATEMIEIGRGFEII